MELNKEQIEFLNRCTLGKWTLNEKTGLVDIEGRFYCYDENLTDFKGVKFGVVTGDFRCFNNSLTSLVGAPKKVGGDFNCTNNKLTSLVGAPQEVGGDFCCYYNKLTSLEGAPQEVGGYFYCDSNKLTSLEGAPQEVGGNSNCDGNTISQKTIDLVWKTMQGKKFEYWEALCMLKDRIPEGHWKKMSKGLEDKITPDAIKTYSIISRYR